MSSTSHECSQNSSLNPHSRKPDIIEIKDNSNSKPTWPLQVDSRTQHKHNIIIISDDGDSKPKLLDFVSQHVSKSKKHPEKAKDGADRCPSKRHSSIVKVIQVLDSSNDEKPSHSASITIKSTIVMPSPDARPAYVLSLESSTDNLNILRDGSGRVVVMRKMKVETIEHLNSIPRCWPVPTSDTAYVLDFSEDAQASTTMNLLA
jgi:hypothetical protein